MSKTDFELFADELREEKSIRSVVIIGSSRIDSTLIEILSKVLIDKVSKVNESDELLEGDSGLGTLSSRIKAVFRLGMMDISFYKNLESLRKLRNICAHSLNLDFKQSSLKDKIQEIKKPILNYPQYDMLCKKYYGEDGSVGYLEELILAYLTICLLLEVILEGSKKIEANTKLIEVTKNKEKNK